MVGRRQGASQWLEWGVDGFVDRKLCKEGKTVAFRHRVFLLMGVLLLLVSSSLASAFEPYFNYTYDSNHEINLAPQAYLFHGAIDGSAVGVGEFRAPRGLATGPDGTIYISDTGNNRIVRVTESGHLVQVIELGFNSPRGLAISEDDHLYVADTDNRRIVKADLDGNLVQEFFLDPAATPGVIDPDFVFRPIKLAVDRVGRLFVIAQDNFEGLMVFNQDGQFRGFVGAPRVAPSLADLFWSRIATDRQRTRMALFLPTEFSGVVVAPRGYVLATKAGTAEADAIRRLSPGGASIPFTDTGFSPVGDIRHRRANGSFVGWSAFVDVVGREHDVFSVLDQRYGRVFTYDGRGRLLYVFGARGTQQGTFQDSVAIATLGDTMLVLDAVKNSVSVFRPTPYADMIHAAISYFDRGLNDEAEHMWREVLRHNANFELAYNGVGYSLFRKDEFPQAMEYFRLGQDRYGYSRAFARYRRQVIEENFSVGATVLVLLVALIFLIRGILRYKPEAVKRWKEAVVQGVHAVGNRLPKWLSRLLADIGGGLYYGLHVIFHPFDGFWDLKHERRGNTAAATVILGLLVLSFIFNRQYEGFVFNERDLTDLNVITEFLSVMIPFALWCIVGAAITTLVDGKGNLRDIYVASAYSFLPIVLMYVPLTIVSNYLILPEAEFYQLGLAFALTWSIGLLVLGTMVTHEYDMTKTLVGMVAIGGGMGFALFLFLVFYEIVGTVVGFVSSVYIEMIFRL